MSAEILIIDDNADIRLTPLSYSLGLASKERMRLVDSKINETSKLIKYYKTQDNRRYIEEEILRSIVLKYFSRIYIIEIINFEYKVKISNRYYWNKENLWVSK